MTDTITELTALEAHFDAPNETAVAAMRKSLDKYQRQYIELSPFVCIATADASGQPTISPKGDAPGFVHIIDERTLVIPDRPGNNKVESFHNLVENPKLALIFMIPGLRETLRISGEAGITTDQDLLKFASVGSRAVSTGLVIKINSVYFHCGKAMIRSRLWDEQSRLAAGVFPSFGQILKEEAKLSDSVEQVDAMMEEVYSKRLY